MLSAECWVLRKKVKTVGSWQSAVEEKIVGSGQWAVGKGRKKVLSAEC